MFQLATMGLGLIGAVGKMIGRGEANKKMAQLAKNDPIYTANPQAAQRLGLAQTLLNARSPGAMAAERNIYSNQANTLSNAQRGATSSSQLLNFAANTQGQTNQAFDKLGQEETNDYQRRYGNLEGAQEGMIREDDKVFADKERRYNNQLQIAGAQNENRQNNWSEVSNLGFGLASFGMNGGFGGGSGGGNTTAPLTGRYTSATGSIRRFNPATGKYE